MGLTQALRTMLKVGDNFASNLTRSQVNGAQATNVSIDAAATDVAGFGAGGTGLSIRQTTRDTSQGAIADSSSPTDLALQGGGYFLLFDQSGNLFMSRNGQFHFNNNGELINNQGLYVASFDPGTTMINKTDKTTVTGSGAADDQVEFNTDGTIVNLSRGNQPGRQLALATVANEQGMSASQTYPGTFQANESTGVIQTGRAGQNGLGTIVPQALEQSNASLPDSVAELATWQGTFKATSSALKALNSAIDDIISTFKPA